VSRSLPSRPSLEHLKKESKAVLAAHRAGHFEGCRPLRLLGRLADAPAGEVLKARVSLQDAQMAVALDYGFASWAAIKRHVESVRAEAPGEAQVDPAAAKTPTCAAAARLFKSLQNDPLCQRSQMWALMVAMRAMGRDDAEYATLMATSGWSGQFIYIPKPGWPTFIEPAPTVERACAAMGVALEQKRPASADEAFDFIFASCAGDRPVVAEHLEFGLFVGTQDGQKPLLHYFVQPFFNDGVWWSRQAFAETFWEAPADKRLFALAGPAKPTPPAVAARQTLAELARLATEDYWTDWRAKVAPNVVTGLRAMEQYAADVADVSHAMPDIDETNKDICFFDRGWGCYAIYPQWTARECSGRYLDQAAGLFEGAAARHIRDAARSYHEAHRAWQQWEQHLGRSEKFGEYDARWADPTHRRAGSEAALSALDSEREAIASVRAALSAIAQTDGASKD